MNPDTYDRAVDRCLRVVDGDTLDLRIDLGFRMTTEQRIRLYGVDSPELHDPDDGVREAAQAAREYVVKWMGRPTCTYTIRTFKSDSFGRWLGVIHRSDLTDSLNDELVAVGLAVPYLKGVA